MVRGRMPRESNPIPREKAGFVSNFDSTGNEDYVRISPDNPMPNANYIQNDSGLWVPVSQENPMPTQETGSIVEKINDYSNILSANSTIFTSSDFREEVDRYNKIFITVNIEEDSSDSPPFEIYVDQSYELGDSYSGYIEFEIKDIKNYEGRFITERKDVMGRIVRNIRIENKSNDDKEFTLTLWGVKV